MVALFPRRALLLAACLLAGAAAALLLMPRVVRWSRDDTSRICSILDACRSGASPRLVVFGNSTGMFGIDTRQLTAELPSRPLAWNFCAPAQTIGEGLLLHDALPSSVTTIVQLVTPRQLADSIAVQPDHYNTMLLCGYKAGGASLAVRWQARRHVRAAMEGLTTDRGRRTHDLYFPADLGRRGGWRPEEQLANLSDDRPVANTLQLQLLQRSAAAAAHARRRFLVVLVPVHPRLRNTPFSCPPRLECADFSTLLREEEFRDPTHATVAGAQRLTTALADEIAARRLLSQ